MSRLGRLGLLTTLVLLLGPGLATAQQTEEQLRQRLDSLRPLLEAAREDLVVFEREVEQSAVRAAAAAAVLDTMSIGLVTVVTPVEQAETARELFTEVWEEHYADITRSPGLERETFTFQWANEHVPIHINGRAQHRIKFQRYTRRERVTDQIRAAIGVSITYDLRAFETDVGRWVQGDPNADADRAAIYRKLVTTGSVSTRSCLEGDVEACTISLGLGGEGDLLTRWYLPEERQAVVASRPNLGSLRASTEVWEACVHGGDIGECDRLLRPPAALSRGVSLHGGFWAPLQGAERASLVSFALDRGGAGAWARLVEEPAMPAAEALEQASRLDLDTLVAEWRAWVIEGRPDVYLGLLPRSGMALVWTLVFAGFAMRSTRWRIA